MDRISVIGSEWLGETYKDTLGLQDDKELGLMSSTSEYGFGLDENISVSTIVEKLVAERLKLGIVKTVARGVEKSASSYTLVEEGDQSSSDEDISSLKICLDKFEKRTTEALKGIDTVGEEPHENPPNVIEPHFSSEESDNEFKDPSNDVHMMLNRTRSFYTPNGFKDSRPDLKKLETEREKMWAQRGIDRYTTLLYEEAIKYLKHVRIKGMPEPEDNSSGEDLVTKTVESLMNVAKPAEMRPEDWDPVLMGPEKFPPYWAIAPPEATNKTINTIRFIYWEIKNADLSKMSLKLRRRTGRKLRKESEVSTESEEEVQVDEVEEVSSEDEPYMLKRKESVFMQKKKVVIEEEEKEEVFDAIICPGLHNIQFGHELSISTIQKLYPDQSEHELQQAESESDNLSTDLSTGVTSKQKVRDDHMIDRSITSYTKLPTTRVSWVKKEDMADLGEDATSEESLFKIVMSTTESHAESPSAKPQMANWRGFPFIKQRPKWKNLQRECTERETKDQSQVERYRCLCNARGIPPIEAVARSIKKKSAVFNRMGQGPQSTIQTMAEVLGPKTKLLDLTGYYLNKADLCYLCQAFQRLTYLKKLRLQRTKLTEEMLAALVSGMNNLDYLCLLDLSYNNLGRLRSDKMRRLPSNLTTLILSRCGLGRDSFTGLGALSPNLRSLDISWNKLNEPAGLKIFANSLLKQKSDLRELRMGWNSLEEVPSARILCDLAKNLKSLNYFDLSYNGFGTVGEMVLFNDMLLFAPKLKVFLFSGNPLLAGADMALLKDLTWPRLPDLQFIDLGDIWVEKPAFQMIKDVKNMSMVEIRVGGVKGNVRLSDLDLSNTFMRRINFLNTPKKKKKKHVKDLGNTMKKLLDAQIEMGEGPRVKSWKLKNAVLDDKLLLDEGLIENLIKSLQDRSRTIDLELTLAKYRAMFPAEVKVEKKKKKMSKKLIEGREVPAIEIVEARLETPISGLNVLFLNADKDKPEKQAPRFKV